MQDSVKQDRDRYIGGSDIPVIMEISPFKSRYDLLLEKAGLKEDTFLKVAHCDHSFELVMKHKQLFRRCVKCGAMWKMKEGE